MDLVLDQGVDGVEEAAGGGMWLCPEAPRCPEMVPTPGWGSCQISPLGRSSPIARGDVDQWLEGALQVHLCKGRELQVVSHTRATPRLSTMSPAQTSPITPSFYLSTSQSCAPPLRRSGPEDREMPYSGWHG